MVRKAKNVALGLIVLLIGGAVALYFFTQALLEYYRPQLVAEISDAVGCPVSYGRATVKLTPAIEVVLHDVSVMGTSFGFEVTAPYLAAEVKIPALINRHLDFDKITLRSPSIVLITGAASNTTPQASPATQPASSAPTPQPEQPLLLAGVDTISIDSGRISRRSASGVESVVLEDLHIQSGLSTQGTAITIEPSQASFVVPVGTRDIKRFPLTASLHQLTYTISQKTLSLQSVQLASGASSVTVSGAFDLAGETVTASVQGTKVELAPFQQFIGVKALGGTSDIQANVTLSEQMLQVTGTLGLSSAKVTATSGESYGITSLSGPFSLQRTQGQGIAIQSDKLAVQGFSYQDPNVSLNHVNGTLSKIAGTIAESGVATFTVSVHGSGLDLSSGPFVIQKISSVDSPLTVKVPATPGYSISGPVKASGVDMTFHGRPLTAASGSVDMLVSDSILRFISQGIQTQSNGIPLKMSGTVEIDDSSYTMKNLVGQLAGGSLASSVTIQRSPKQDVAVEVLAKELDVTTVKALVTGDSRSSFSGRVDHISVKATARKDDLLSSATGNGVIEITDGSVARANFDRKVVGLIKAIPVVGEAVSFTSSATDSSTYEMKGGMLKDLTADFTIGNGRVSSSNIKAQGKFSNLVASGDISFHGELNLTASAVYLEQNLRAIAGPIKPLGALFGTIGRIEIPLLISGHVDNPQISADLSRLQDISMPGRALSPIFRGLESVVNGSTGN